MAKDKKKRSGKRAYLNDFKPNVAGEFIYTGKTYRWQQDRKPVLLRLWLLSGIAAAATLINGCISGTGMDKHFWTLLPWVISLVAALSMVYAVGRLTFAGEQVREYILEATVEKIPMRGMICAVFAGVSAVGGIVNLFLADFAGNLVCGVIFVVLQGASAGCSVVLRRTVERLEWAKE